MKKILDKKILNHQQTEIFARNLVKKYLAKDENFTIFFEGGLGAGKTYIIREILAHLGVTDEITSPTYVYLNEYTSPDGRHYAHFDLYRIKSDEEFFTHGFEEILADENICKFVEWPDKISREIRHLASGVVYFVNIKHGISAGLRQIKVYRGE